MGLTVQVPSPPCPPQSCPDRPSVPTAAPPTWGHKSLWSGVGPRASGPHGPQIKRSISTGEPQTWLPGALRGSTARKTVELPFRGAL